MKSWEEFKVLKEANLGLGLGNPADDVDQYIAGVSNKLMLLDKEQIEVRRERLKELVALLNSLLR